MTPVDRGEDSGSVDQMMSRILVAERDARDAVDRCRSEAAQILAAAQEGVRRIAKRTETRVKLIHRIADEAAERTLRELRGTGLGAEPALSKADAHDLLDRAVDALVDEILSAKP